MDELFNKITTLMIDAFHDLGINIIRSEDAGDKPDYPYATWKILSVEGENDRAIIRTNESVSGNKTKITEKEKFNSVVSLTFYGIPQNIAQIYLDVDTMITWLRNEGRKKAESYGLTIRLTSPNIQDRTTVLENKYEVRAGLDINILYIDVKERLIESVQKVNLQNTDSGEELTVSN